MKTRATKKQIALGFVLSAIFICGNIKNSTGAVNYYVSPAGNNANSGTTSGTAFKTISKAASMVVAGGTVHVAAGTYAETIVTTAIGTASARIRYVSDTKWGAIIVPVSGAYTMWSAKGGYTDIDGFQIDGTGSTSVRVGIYLNGGNSSVKNCSVHNVAENSGCDSQGGGGLVADQGSGSAYTNYDFINNIVHHVGAGCGWIQGIYHSSTGNIKNNLIYACSQGINMGHDDHNINVVNNTLFGNSGYGVYYGGCKEAYNNGCPTSGIRIHNNIIYDNAGGVQGPVTAEDVNNELKNNLIYGNTNNFDLASPSNNSRTGEVSANPQFVNYIRTGGGNYHLKSNSPAIDKGIATYAPSTDLDGIARPQGAGFDIGAYEYTLTTGIENGFTNENSFVLYPNPFTENFTLKISSEIILKDAVMKIYDVCGKEVKVVFINSNETTIDRGELQSGIYFYSIINNSDSYRDENVGKGKLIVQ